MKAAVQRSAYQLATLLVSAVAITAILSASSASAQTTYDFIDETGGTQEWTDSTNWSGGVVPNPVSGDTITANLTMDANTFLNLGADRTFTNWTSSFQGFGGTQFTINSGNTITFAGAAPTIDHSSKGKIIFDNILGGTDGLIKAGSATVALNNAGNTFSGGIELANGILEIASDGALGDVSNNINVSGSSSIGLANGTYNRAISIASGATLSKVGSFSGVEITGAITGDGGLATGTTGFELQKLTLSSTSNTFAGNLKIGRADSGTEVIVNSLADSVGSNIELVTALKGVGSVFAWGTGATSSLVLDNRQLVISGNRDDSENVVLRNDNTNSSNTITINQDVSVTATVSETLELSGVNTGSNTLGGALSNGAGSSVMSLLKSGAGTWNLGGANTYTGNTTVSGGTLNITTTGELLFDIGAAGVNNSILGSGAINIDGTLVFDLTSASTTVDDFWNIVDVGSLSETYGGTFSVESTLGAFIADGGGDLWTIDENGVTYEFSESTGILTVTPIPEPGVALLSGIGLLMLLRRRRA